MPVSNSIELILGQQKFLLRSEESEDHLKEVAELVKRKVDTIRKGNASLSLQRASVLAAFELASEIIKGKRKANEYRANVIARAGQILDKVENHLASTVTPII